MTLLILGLLLIGSGALIVPGLISGLVAWHKGYRPWFWLLSGGPVGSVVIAPMPGVNHATNPEEREQLESRANWIGGILSVLTGLLIVGTVLAGFVALELS